MRDVVFVRLSFGLAGKVLAMHPGEAGPTGLDSVHPWACAHIISPVFGDGALDRFWRTGTQHTRQGGSKHICVAANSHPVGKGGT